MVQRKAIDKLGILADSKTNVKSDKWSMAIKPSAPQHQDIQEKDETELKKNELKKSRSIKLLDLENIEPLPTRRPKSRFNKQPTNSSNAAITPQAPSVIRKRDPSPNYMKPTSSSDAKKERSQVSSLDYQASSPRKSLSPNPSGRNSTRMSLSPCPSGRTPNRQSQSPCPTGRNSHGISLSPSPSGRNSHRMSLSPAPCGRSANSLSPYPTGRSSSRMSPSPAPSGRNSNSLSPCPSGRNSSRMSQSPAPTGRNANSLSPRSSGRNSSGLNPTPAPTGRNANSLSPSPCERNSSRMSPSPCPSGRSSNRMSLSPCPSGRNSSRLNPSPCPSGRSSNRMSLSPCPSRNPICRSRSPSQSGRNSRGNSPSESNSYRMSLSPCPSGRNSRGKSPSPILEKRNLDHQKLPCSASSHKPMKTSTKTSSLKPVRTLTKTPSFKSGAELKKQIKKSGSIKLLDLESLQSSATEQPSGAAVTPQKWSLMKTPHLLPNYMKPTSSSGARKEQLQLNTPVSEASYPKMSPTESDSIRTKHSSASGHKPARTLMKTSSLKPVRTLTKTSSLKLARPSMRKSSETAQSSNLQAGKPTCSSTLKDSKFPDFLTLNPGATESEGTSAMKVCPYTYCSLNGHHHTPMPLLKHFVSARRRLLKTQKSSKMKSLPLLPRPAGERKMETAMDQMAFNEDSTTQEGIDFFVEIYAKPREGTATPIGKSVQEGDNVATILGGMASSEIHGYEIEKENDTEKTPESQPDKLSYSGISFEDNIDQNDNLKAEMDIPASQHDQLMQVNATDLDGEIVAPPTDIESDLMPMYSPESKSPRLQEELVFGPDDDVNKSKEYPVGYVEQQVHMENAESFSMEYGDDDSETDTEDRSFLVWLGVPTNASGAESGTSSCPDENSLSSTDLAFEETATTMEEQEEAPKPDDIVNSMAHPVSIDGPIATSDEEDEKPQAENFFQQHPEPIPITEVVNNALENKEESSSIALTSNLVGSNVEGNEEGKKEAEDFVEHDDHGGKSSDADNSIEEKEETVQVVDYMEPNATEADKNEGNITCSKKDKRLVDKEENCNQQLPMTFNLKRTMRCRKPVEDQEEPRNFNPREPHYLDIEPEPEPEKVDLRHQTEDERKNAEEWMLDHALQQTVNKLAPARKQRVALLVEAFEAVIPPPNRETRRSNTSAAFSHTRRIQACN